MTARADVTSGTRQVCTCSVAGVPLCIDVEFVQEVLRPQTLTPIPLAQEAVRGLVNLRGQVVTAIDLRRLLGLQPPDDEGRQFQVVLRVGDDVVALLVDEVGDVIEPDAAAFEPAPPTLVGAARSLVKGVCKLPDQLLMVLDADRARLGGLSDEQDDGHDIASAHAQQGE